MAENTTAPNPADIANLIDTQNQNALLLQQAIQNQTEQLTALLQALIQKLDETKRFSV